MKKIFILIMMIMMLSLTSCDFGQIEDTNGDDDYSLCYLTDEDILNSKSSSKVGSVSSRINNEGTTKAKKMSGVETILNIDEIYETKLTINFKVEKGNGVVTIVKNNQIVHILKANETKTFILLPGGKYTVKIAGESCQFELSYTIE